MRPARPLLLLLSRVVPLLGFVPSTARTGRLLHTLGGRTSILTGLGSVSRAFFLCSKVMATQPGLADIGYASGGAADRPKELEGDDGEEAESCGNAPQWMKDLKRSMNRNKQDAYHRFVQLSTIAEHEDGTVRPACRSVVFRGFLGDSEVLKIITDSRSEKVGQVAKNPYAEVCWYLVRTREQYRISGQLRIVTHEETDGALQAARREQWAGLSDNARIQFAWPTPGAAQEGVVDKSIFHPPNPDPASPPDTFCLVLLYPSRVDHLLLKGDPQTRTLHTLVAKEGEKGEQTLPVVGSREWRATPVNP